MENEKNFIYLSMAVSTQFVQFNAMSGQAPRNSFSTILKQKCFIKMGMFMKDNGNMAKEVAQENIFL